MAFKIGRNQAVKIGANSLVGMGTWQLTGVETDLLEDTEFGDQWKTYQPGLKDGGQITFNGLYDPADTNGQVLMISACDNASSITDLKLFIDATSYYLPATTNPASFVMVTQYQVEADKAELTKVSFTAKISGKMTLV